MLWSATTVDVGVADVATVTGVLGDVAGVRRWLDGVEIACTTRLAVLAVASPSLFPEQIHATATRSGLRAGVRAAERAKTVATIAELGDVLTAGDTSSDHVDAVTGVLRGLSAAQRRMLASHGATIAGWAARSVPEEFRTQLAALVRRIEADDGVGRLARQKRAVRFRTWIDKVTGMVRLSGELDAETGATFTRRLDNQLDTLFHDHTPPDCPDDPIARQDFLRAHALLDLTHPDTRTEHHTTPVQPDEATVPDADADADATVNTAPVRPPSRPARTGPGKAEITIVIDMRTLTHGHHPNTRLDCGIDGVQLPLDTIRRIALYADIIPILLDDNGVILKMGRTRRLATRDQRHALQAMYRTCAIPACTTTVRHCEPHHTTNWGHHGLTDIDTLIPICKHHHDTIHARHWTLTLTPDRHLTITKPDGTTMTTGPPKDQWR